MTDTTPTAGGGASKEGLTMAQFRILKWLDQNEHHFAGWDDDRSKLTLRGKKQITISAADWNEVNLEFIGDDGTRKRVFALNDAGRAALSRAEGRTL